VERRAVGLIAFYEAVKMDGIDEQRIALSFPPKPKPAAEEKPAGCCPECGATCIGRLPKGGKRCRQCGTQFDEPGVRHKFPTRDGVSLARSTPSMVSGILGLAVRRGVCKHFDEPKSLQHYNPSPGLALMGGPGDFRWLILHAKSV
jgi:hypothetical protein